MPFLIGIPMALIKISEPFVYFEIIGSAKNVFRTLTNTICCKSKAQKEQDLLKAKKSGKYVSEPLDSFLNQSINIEFVSLILMGINNFMDLQKHL